MMRVAVGSSHELRRGRSYLELRLAHSAGEHPSPSSIGKMPFAGLLQFPRRKLWN